MSWPWWPGHLPTIWGKFWVHRYNIAHLRPRSKKMEPKIKNLKQGDKLSVFVCQNWMKNAKLWPCEARAPKWRWPFWAIRWPFLATFFEIWPSNVFCLNFGSILIGKPIYYWIPSNLGILCHKNDHARDREDYLII